MEKQKLHKNFVEECYISTEEKKWGIAGKVEEVFGTINSNGSMIGGNKRDRDGDDTTVSNNITVNNVMFL